ncbi:MAG: 3-dehydroquinate synthase [Candidatus Omnitrophica bacterium]|nr:3-dehydroquinate synthase [Candidatus Omnitrophota bacterium]
MKTIKIRTARGSYNIHAGRGILKHFKPLVAKAGLPRRAVIVTTSPILRLLRKKIENALRGFDTLYLLIPDTEKSKNADLALRLIEKITPFDRGKDIFLAALGGGVAGDLTGFMAAIYKRGVPYLQIPTSLLAQIDSSIGGKTAVDTRFGKNLIGAFYPPRFVLIDTRLLSTLPKKELISGLSEGVKYGLISDPLLFRWIQQNVGRLLKADPAALEHLVQRCAAIKAGIVSRDEFDKKDIRIVLNFGHTIGHAVEAASGFALPHGPSIAIGMVCACELSERLGGLKKGTTRHVIALLEDIGLPTKIPARIMASSLKALTHDKKFKAGKNRFVLLQRIGRTRIVENIPEGVIRDVLKSRLA